MFAAPGEIPGRRFFFGRAAWPGWFDSDDEIGAWGRRRPLGPRDRAGPRVGIWLLMEDEATTLVARHRSAMGRDGRPGAR